ncbi:MAG: hypothetical protein HY606_05255 [Planctomycetes bacterium]|nr:hypothetical protein [Planctomycetota bacterium]
MFDAIGSCVKRVQFPEDSYLYESGAPYPGDVLAVKIIDVNTNYNILETTAGKRIKLVRGQKIIGAAGTRWALRGFIGTLPDELKAGDIINVLNIGGVIGECIDYPPYLGKATTAEFLGFISSAGGRINLGKFTPQVGRVTNYPPIIAVIGTCMNTGKTTATSALIKQFTGEGVNVACGKLSGVAAIKDVQEYTRSGAKVTATFNDFGWASSADITNISQVALRIIRYLAFSQPDLIILELGDGVIGKYGVSNLLSSVNFTKHVSEWVLCASDPAAAFGALKYISSYGIEPRAISGPVSDNLAGISAVAEFSTVPVISAIKSPDVLHKMMAKRVVTAV